MRNQYAPVSTDPSGAVSQRGSVNKFRRRMWALGALACLLLLAIYIHNIVFYASLRPLVDSLLSMEDDVLQSQKDFRNYVFKLLSNISVVFEGRPANDDMLRDVGATDLTETSEYQEYLNMKDRNERLEDEIKFLVMRSNVDEDPVKQLQYELEQEQRKTQQLSSTQQAKASLLNKIHDLQNVADKQVGTSAKTDEEMKKLVTHMETMQAELARKRQELSAARHSYHEAIIYGRRVDEAMGVYMDDGAAIGHDVLSLDTKNISRAVQTFANQQKSKPDTWDRGPEPLLCYSLVEEATFQKQPGGGDPLAVLAFRRWSKVCGRYILFAEAFDTIPDYIAKPVESGGYGLIVGEDIVVLTPKKHSTPLKSWEKFGYAILFLSQHIGCDKDNRPLNPVEGVAEGTRDATCLNLARHEWFVHLDVQTYFFRPNLYYLLDRLARKHADDWLTVTDPERLDFRKPGEYIGLPNFSEHIAHNSGFFFLVSKPTIDTLTTAFRESKKRGSDQAFETRCSWSQGRPHSFLSTCVDGCASHPDLITAQRLCEEVVANPNSGGSCGGVISVSPSSFQLRVGNQPQFLASSSETAYVMTCSRSQIQSVQNSAQAYPQNCGLTKEAPFDEQLGRCLFDLSIFLRKTSDMYGREAFAIVNPYRISEIENYPVLQKYFDGRFNENFGTPQNHFSPLLVATYMGFEPASVGACATALFDRITASSRAAALAQEAALVDFTDVLEVQSHELSQPLYLSVLEEQLKEVKNLLDKEEDQRDCAH